MAQRLTSGQRFGYAFGSFGTGGFATVPGLVLLFYLTDVLGVAAAIASLVVFIPKAWDVIIAPVMGGVSDKTMLRHGSRVRWLLVGGLIIGPMFALTFAAPSGLQGNAAALWVGVFFLFAITGFATFQVTYLAMPAEFTDDYAERTKIMSIRIVFLTLSILLFGAGAPILVNAFGSGRTGYAGMGVVVGVLLVVATVVCWAMLRKTKSYTQAETEPSFKERVAAVRENRWFLLLGVTFVCQALGVGAMLAAVPYLATYILGGGELEQTLLFACLVAPAILVMPLWSITARRVGKHRGFLMASGIFLIAAHRLVLQSKSSGCRNLRARGDGRRGLRRHADVPLGDAPGCGLSRCRDPWQPACWCVHRSLGRRRDRVAGPRPGDCGPHPRRDRLHLQRRRSDRDPTFKCTDRDRVVLLPVPGSHDAAEPSDVVQVRPDRETTRRIARIT